MSNILVTGSAGFIGSHLVDELILKGHTVVGVDNLSTGFKKNIHKHSDFYEIDICSTDAVNNVFKNHKFDYVFHLAAQINLRLSIREPVFDAKNNILGSLNLLEQTAKQGAKFVFASTGGAIYNSSESLPFTENSATKPLSPYGLSKLTIENYLSLFKDLYDLKYTVLRYSNVYGPRQNAKGEAGVLAIFIDKLLEGKPVIIFGDGSQTRDYIYVKDVVDANILAMEVDGVYNVSTGKSTSVNDVLKLIKPYFKQCRATNSSPIHGEMKHSCLDSSLLQSKGWKINYDLELGIESLMMNDLIGINLHNFIGK